MVFAYLQINVDWQNLEESQAKQLNSVSAVIHHLKVHINSCKILACSGKKLREFANDGALVHADEFVCDN
jgi:hypothetical protein